MQPNHIIVLTDELLKRVFMGLGELPAKLSHQVILEIEGQVKLAEENVAAYVGLVEQHLAAHKSKLPHQAAPTEMPGLSTQAEAA